MNNYKSLISIVMPTYNTPEPFLRKSIESMLKQTFTKFELIIIDDASTNDSQKVIKSYSDSRIKYVKNRSNLGITKSLNVGLSLAKGKYIARMDADDISLSQRLEKQFLFMETNLEVSVLGAEGYRFGGKTGKVRSLPKSKNRVRAKLFFNNRGIIHPSVIIRKSFLERNNLFYDEAISKSQDYDLWNRCLDYGVIKVYPEVLILYRNHQNQASVTDKSGQNVFVNLIREKQVSKLGISMNRQEKIIHNCLCDGVGIMNLDDTFSWVEKLIQKNRIVNYINPKDFEREIMGLWLILYLKYFKKNKPLNIQRRYFMLLLNPKYYHIYTEYVSNKFNNILVTKSFNELTD